MGLISQKLTAFNAIHPVVEADPFSPYYYSESNPGCLTSDQFYCYKNLGVSGAACIQRLILGV